MPREKKEPVNRRFNEQDFQLTVTDLADLTGWYWIHFNDSRKQVKVHDGYKLVGDSGARGWPDLVLWHPTRNIVIFRELKNVHKDDKWTACTKNQLLVLSTLSTAGADVDVWCPDNWDEIEKLLKGE